MSTFNRARDRDDRGCLKRTYRRPPWSMATPSWFVREHMNIPRRRANRLLCRWVELGHDPEAIVWPLGNHKPHEYYW